MLVVLGGEEDAEQTRDKYKEEGRQKGKKKKKKERKKTLGQDNGRLCTWDTLTRKKIEVYCQLMSKRAYPYSSLRYVPFFVYPAAKSETGVLEICTWCASLMGVTWPVTQGTLFILATCSIISLETDIGMDIRR